MKRGARNAPQALELLERGVALLRSAPMAAWAAYLAGVAPFALGLLYFWAEMSRGAFARRRCGAESVALSCLFLWMKFWQSVFCQQLRAHLSGMAPERWTVKRTIKTAALQIAAQSWGLIAIPFASAILFPFAWVFASFQNLTVLGADPQGIRAALRKASSLAALWPGNNHLLLLLLALVGFFAWLNVAAAFVLVPFLLKSLLGIQTIFTLGGVKAYLNSTMLLSSFVFAWFFVDPLVKAAYLLRCFHGLSLHSAEDLRVELAWLRRAAAAALLALSLFTGASLRAETNAVSSSQLNQSIEKALQQDEFTWRMPRLENPTPDAQKSWLSRLIDETALALRETAAWISRVWRAVQDWLNRLVPVHHESDNASGLGRVAWGNILQVVVVILIIAICCLIAVLALRAWQQRTRRADYLMAEAISAQPDLADESVTATQLPEDGWLKLAAELLQKGELRLALRAYYLASLAHLGAREMIAIAAFKSNRDYESELRWRRRAQTDLHAAFAENGAIFDRVWYGLHEVTHDALGQFQSNLERIRSC